MATGVRTPVGIRIVSSDPPRLDALGAALRARGRAARDAQRGLRVAGRRDLGRLRRRPGGAGRYGVDPAVVASTADLLTTGGQIGELDGGRAPPARARLARAARRPARGPTDQLRDVDRRARGAGAHGRAAGAARPAGRPAYVRRPAALRTEHGELCAYVYVDPRRRHRPAELRRARAPGGRRRGRGRRDPARARRAHRVGRAVRAAGRRASGACAGSSRWSRCSMLGLLFLQFRSLTEALHRARLGAVRAGRQLLDAVPARLSAVGAGLGRPALGRRPGDADRRGHGGLHRRGVLTGACARA